MLSNTSGASKKVVGVLRGGPSHGYELSLEGGSHILQNLPESFRGQDIFISRDGDWHVGGIRRDPDKILGQVDVVWNALHGNYGEDGKVQHLLEYHRVPYTGSSSLASALAMNKNLTRKTLVAQGFKMPIATVVYPKDNTYEKLFELFRTFPQPSIIKPISGGSSIGVTVALQFEDFKKGIERAFLHGGAVLIEEYIRGREVTCVVVDDRDGGGSYALFPVEVLRDEGSHYFDYDLKYKKSREHLCPSSLSAEEKAFIQNAAVDAHHHLGLRHYSSADFILSPQRGLYLLEVNSLPGLTQTSLLSQTLKATGTHVSNFIEHILSLALKK